MRSGTPPSHSNTFSNAWHVHSAFSPGISREGATFEYGKSSTKWCMRAKAPRHCTSTSPKSACASPGCHTRSMNPAPRSETDSPRSLATVLVTVDRETSAPCSSRSRSQIRVAV